MAKYLDSNGLSHFMGILKGLLHKHTIPSSAFDTTTVPNVTSVGSAPTLGTAFTIPNIASKTVVTSHTAMSAVPDSTHPATFNITKDSSSTGDSVTTGTAFTVPNVTSVGSAPTLGTAKTVLSGVKSSGNTTGTAHINDNS